MAITWVRQTRAGGDAWEPVEVPLGEAREEYRVDVLGGDAVLRTMTTGAAAATYAASAQIADFGVLPGEVTIRVRQVSATDGPGQPVQRRFTF